MSGDCEGRKRHCDTQRGRCEAARRHCMTARGDYKAVRAGCKTARRHCMAARCHCGAVRGHCDIVRGRCEAMSRHCAGLKCRFQALRQAMSRMRFPINAPMRGCRAPHHPWSPAAGICFHGNKGLITKSGSEWKEKSSQGLFGEHSEDELHAHNSLRISATVKH